MGLSAIPLVASVDACLGKNPIDFLVLLAGLCRWFIHVKAHFAQILKGRHKLLRL